MSAHLIADTTITATAPDTSAGAAGWCALSAALTDEVPTIADREDLIVTIAPGAGQGAPACFLPTLATIELDATHLDGVDPATATPHRIGDRARYPTAWGLLTHECAHARHTMWRAPADTPAGIKDAAALLEESRIEAAQIRRRRDDRHWLRASATKLILADTRASDPATAPHMTRWDAGRAAALLLARVDAGILTHDETAPVASVVDTVLGADTVDNLRGLWQTAHGVADDDTDTILDLGARWCRALAVDPDQQPTPPTPTPPTPAPPDPASTGAVGGPGLPGGGKRGHGPATPSPLAAAITESVARVGAAVAREPVPADPATLARDARTAAHAARTVATAAAHAVITHGRSIAVGGVRAGRTTIAGSRAPTTAERTAARTLARALTTAGIRDRTVTKTSAATPPGRLRMRGALAADAQRAAGAAPTAEPFTRVTRRTVPTPPLRLGIACDVSGSMGAYAAPVASAAWILAHAAGHTQGSAETATVIFGNRVRSITAPGELPAVVTEFDAKDNYEDIATAIDSLDGALQLSRPGAARLLVIVSDGHYRTDPRRDGQTRITRLRAAGCGVLWLAPTATTTRPLDGATVHPLTDPAATAQAIGRAATTALRTC